MSLNNPLIRSLLLGFILLPQLALALSSDREKPIEIESDSAEIDNNKGVSVYRGDVIMTQGTTRITGDKITIHSLENEVQRVIAVGYNNRAYYEELQDRDQGLLQAWGYTIDYQMEKDQVELIRDGELKNQGDIFKGEKINYNISLQTVNATSEQEEGTSRRVQMVIHPKPKSESSAQPASAR